MDLGDLHMKIWTTPLALLLCISLLLGFSGCATESGTKDTTAPITSTAPSTLPAPKPEEMYHSAVNAVSKADNLCLSIDYSESRIVGSETYSEAYTATANYAGLNGGNTEALIAEHLVYGDYGVDYVQSYLTGTAYCQINGQSFQSSMPFKKFFAMQVPACLLDAALYSTVSYEETDNETVITFSNASAMESWAADFASAQLISAEGTATLDANGDLLNTAYHAEYLLNTTAYTLDVTVDVSTPDDLDLYDRQPKYPENCPQLSCFNTPKMLAQVVGDVYFSQSITGSATESLQCEATPLSRTQITLVDIFDSGADFIARTDYTVTLTDFTHTPVKNTKTETFLDGVYSYSTNGSDPVVQDRITPEKMHTYCEDTLLSALFTPNYLSGAELTDTGDFYCLTFTGNESFAEDLFDEIYRIVNMELDSAASQYTTNEASGYLTISKYTGLPTAMGLALSRTHVIEGIRYTTAYHLDQALTLSSTQSYENITGEAPEESKPAQTATPLFYKVTGAEGETMWLLGTIHVGDHRTASLPQEILSALQSSDALAVEFDVRAFEAQSTTDPALQSQLAAAYYSTDNSTLSKHLDSTLYEQAYKLLLASGNRSVNALYMKAFAWNDLITNFYIQQSYDLSTKKGVDIQLLNLAYAQEKPVVNIESGLSQLQMFSGFSKKLQAALLSETVSTSLADYNKELRQLYEYWCEGDADALAAALAGDASNLAEEDVALYEEYTNAMFAERNAHMADTAISYLESGETMFFAVGLAHLLGDGGLVDALQTAGYTVEIVSYA